MKNPRRDIESGGVLRRSGVRGEDAIKKVKRQKPHLVLTDLSMPKMSASK